MDVIREVADRYQKFFNFMSNEHGLTLTISEMDEILREANKLYNKLTERNFGDEGDTCSHVWERYKGVPKCKLCGEIHPKWQ